MRDRVVQPSGLTARVGEIPVSYVYTVGVAAEPFFREIKERGQLLAARCPECGIVYLPANMFCERCFAELEPPQPVAAHGIVSTFTVAAVDLEDNHLETPEVWAFIAVDGTDGGLLHRLLADPADVYIGMPVEAVFIPEAERVGSMLDIKGFKPV